MAGFSGSAAVGAGFSLIRREPLAFLAWTAVYVVVAILPQIWMWSSLMPVMAGIRDNAEPSMAAMMQMQQQMLVAQPVVLMASLLSSVLLMGAAFRAVLQPDERAFFYLRLNAQEFWLGLILIVLAVIFFIGAFAAMIPVFIVVGVAAAGGGDGGVLLIFPLMLILFAVVVWAWMRLSLALPMSFAERTFRLPEAWELSKGHAGKMFLVAAVVTIITYVVQIACLAVGFAVIGAAVPLGDAATLWIDDPAALVERLGPPVWLSLLALVALVATWYSTMFAAGLARIYADLQAAASDPRPS